jgi:hypothetical protein
VTTRTDSRLRCVPVAAIVLVDVLWAGRRQVWERDAVSRVEDFGESGVER